jgi:cytochrome P450
LAPALTIAERSNPMITCRTEPHIAQEKMMNTAFSKSVWQQLEAVMQEILAPGLTLAERSRPMFTYSTVPCNKQ